MTPVLIGSNESIPLLRQEQDSPELQKTAQKTNSIWTSILNWISNIISYFSCGSAKADEPPPAKTKENRSSRIYLKIEAINRENDTSYSDGRLDVTLNRKPRPSMGIPLNGIPSDYPFASYPVSDEPISATISFQLNGSIYSTTLPQITESSTLQIERMANAMFDVSVTPKDTGKSFKARLMLV